MGGGGVGWGLGWGWNQIVFHRKMNLIALISRTTVTHPLFERYLYVSCPFNMRYWSVLSVTLPEVDRSTAQVERTSMVTYRILTVYLTHENRILTYK